MKRELLTSSFSSPHLSFIVLAKRNDSNLIADGWIREKQCLVTVTKPDITTGS
jgi:hypothetical protein